MENSQERPLGTLISSVQHFGSACFPVTDVQGNVRGYADTSGVQSAYAYYPYGTLIDLAHGNADDSRRWQSKEFDSDLNKYYFGARFYDPLNYIDPNGESVTAAVAKVLPALSALRGV